MQGDASDGMNTRVAKIIASVLGVPASSLSDDSRQETTPGWDSLAHIHLVMGLEAEFGVCFSPEQAVQMTSVRTIRDALAGIEAKDAR